MAADWAAWATAQPDGRLGGGIMLAGRRDHVDTINRTARTLLRAAGRLGPDTTTAAGRAYALGDRVVCLRNDKRLQVTNGTRGQVSAVDPATGQVTVQVDGPDPAAVLLPGWYLHAGHLGHGYALTVHKAQGATVDRAWVCTDTRTVNAEWLYTALSRHRDTTHLYTSVTTLDDLAIDLEAHAPRSVAVDRDDHDVLRALAARSAQSRAQVLATDYVTPAPAIPEQLVEPPSPPGPEWPEPMGLSL